MLSQRSRIESARNAVIVMHDRPALLRQTMLRDLDVPFSFPVAIDLELDAYRAWGLRRAGLASTYLLPRVLIGYARMIGRGERLHSGTDPRQLGGDFVVGADGRIAYVHPQAAVDDRPSVGLLVRELERAAAHSPTGNGG